MGRKTVWGVQRSRARGANAKGETKAESFCRSCRPCALGTDLGRAALRGTATCKTYYFNKKQPHSEKGFKMGALVIDQGTLGTSAAEPPDEACAHLGGESHTRRYLESWLAIQHPCPYCRRQQHGTARTTAPSWRSYIYMRAGGTWERCAKQA